MAIVTAAVCAAVCPITEIKHGNFNYTGKPLRRNNRFRIREKLNARTYARPKQGDLSVINSFIPFCPAVARCELALLYDGGAVKRETFPFKRSFSIIKYFPSHERASTLQFSRLLRFPAPSSTPSSSPPPSIPCRSFLSFRLFHTGRHILRLARARRSVLTSGYMTFLKGKTLTSLLPTRKNRPETIPRLSASPSSSLFLPVLPLPLPFCSRVLVRKCVCVCVYLLS